jgi:hypothetical protein
MATAQGMMTSTERSRARTEYPPSSIRFDYVSATLSMWFLFGLFIDGWAHNHNQVDETFFTPWHAVLYSGYLAQGLFLVGSQFRNINRGHAFMRALPRGYLPSLIGVIIFGFAGGSDFVWHNLFGFEANTEALLSPAHLALATGAFLFITGPIRAAWHRQNQVMDWRSTLPLILALLGVASLLTFFVQYATATGDLFWLTGRRQSESWHFDMRGSVGILVHSAIFLGVTLVAARRWRLPFGTFTVIYAINGLLMTWLAVEEPAQYLLTFAFAGTGLLVDVLLRRWQPLLEHPTQLRIFAFLMPFVFGLAYMGVLQIVGMMVHDRGLWWRIHMWLGVPFTAGIGGYFLSFIAVPPAIPQDDE